MTKFDNILTRNRESEEKHPFFLNKDIVGLEIALQKIRDFLSLYLYVQVPCLGRWEGTQQVEHVWLVWSGLPSQVQDERNESIVGSSSRPVHEFQNSLFRFVGQCKLVSSGHIVRWLNIVRRQFFISSFIFLVYRCEPYALSARLLKILKVFDVNFVDTRKHTSSICHISLTVNYLFVEYLKVCLSL